MKGFPENLYERGVAATAKKTSETLEYLRQFITAAIEKHGFPLDIRRDAVTPYQFRCVSLLVDELKEHGLACIYLGDYYRIFPLKGET